MKQDLLDAVDKLGPIAEALVVLRDNVGIVNDLERRAERAQEGLSKIQEAVSKAKAELADAEQTRDQMKAESTESFRMAQQTLVDVNAQAHKILNQAKSDANEAAKRELDKYTSDLAKLAEAKAKAQSELDSLDEAIAIKRQAHKEISDAASVLSRRLAS